MADLFSLTEPESKFRTFSPTAAPKFLCNSLSYRTGWNHFLGALAQVESEAS